jgi:glycosyltransferase involved in cell wall biosynthesis
VWAPTRGELDEIAALGGPARLVSMPNLVDVAAYPDLAATAPEDDTLLFVANFAYAPNANAARRLLGRILPAVRQARPSARLLLVGGGMDPTLRALAARTPAVEAPGFVDDLTPWYRRAAVVLLPVREGAGMLFKAIEALAFGKPVAGFPESFRGIEADGVSAFLTAGSARDLAASAGRLLADAGARRMLGQEARALAKARLSWDRGLECLERSLLAGMAA